MEIIICDKCKGTGSILVDVGSHHAEYEREKCVNCDGSGKLYTKTYRYTTSFLTPSNIRNEVDSEILNLLRKNI